MNKPIGAIDGDKLLEWAFSNGYFSLKSADQIAYALEQGTFNLSNQGEATRLREALNNIIRDVPYSDTPAKDAVKIAREALSSSHREDGIQKVRELYEGCKERGGKASTLAIEATLEYLGITIPGITEEKKDG